MLMRKQKPAQPDEGQRWLEIDASMTGSLAFKEPVNLQINGRFEGSLDAKGSLVIGEHASVRADIRAETVSIGGRVEGNVQASTRLELRQTAHVIGKIITPRLIVQDGAVVVGSIEMVPAPPGPGGWMDTEELARYLEVDAPTIEQWAQEGRLPFQKEGTVLRFDRSQIEEWLAHEKTK